MYLTTGRLQFTVEKHLKDEGPFFVKGLNTLVNVIFQFFLLNKICKKKIKNI